MKNLIAACMLLTLAIVGANLTQLEVSSGNLVAGKSHPIDDQGPTKPPAGGKKEKSA